MKTCGADMSLPSAIARIQSQQPERGIQVGALVYESGEAAVCRG
ncbi:hypothetical protein PN498_15865 [Oscillatoria sp. CS-180]|nr:hypothetical protein [Oscillatoria sp. CS-180]MDB9527475.1 hypothetical protein [Oscillatoria sp. CS-180]